MNLIYSLVLLFPAVFGNFPRLSKNVTPISYTLELEIILPGYDIKGTNGFTGNVHINLNIEEDTDVIILHAAKNIQISRGITLLKQIKENGKSKTNIITKYIENNEYQEIQLHFMETIKKNLPTFLTIYYESTFNENRFGLFLSEYNDGNNENKTAASTQFEPFFARSVVPCFDEPDFKATWTVTLRHPSGTIALSNTPTVSEEHSYFDNMIETRFEKTPRMSSYLLAFVVCEFGFKAARSQSGTPVRVFAPSSEISDVDVILNAAVESLNYFENKTNIPFSLPKLDLINFDFPAGMENWGLIVLGGVLYNDTNELNSLIAHEVAHQWFGNLVTAEWWNEIWLNEGFATFYEALGLDYLTNGNQSFAENVPKNAMTYLNEHTFGIDNEVATITNIDSLQSIGNTFGIGTYFKGSAILNMFRNVIGWNNFDQAIINYLKENAYANTNSSIFFSYFQMPNENGPSSVDEFLRPWLEQVGHPLVTIDHFNETHNILSQSRFDNGKLKEIDDQTPYPIWEYQWDIPVWYLDTHHQLKLVWLRQNSTALIGKNVSINPGANGIFRVWSEVDFSDDKFQDPANRIEIYQKSRIDNAFAFALSKRITIEKYERIVHQLGHLYPENQHLHNAQIQVLHGSENITNYKATLGANSIMERKQRRLSNIEVSNETN
ncbi:unnamed protein product [Caenorhabditis angaria]|uniref:Peptidase M1 membrane alanine aminopeptidase domain-containing protein n=1 Tax=Caenorhabditis angaria TaxID=860376 RepID=A0A9P1J2P7_9PELO|nr:unnamed protein product [Caenorhabditis angaria]